MKKYLIMIGKIFLYVGLFYGVGIGVIQILIKFQDGPLKIFVDTPSGLFGIISLVTLLIYFLIAKIRKKNFMEEFDLQTLDKKTAGKSFLIAFLMGIFSIALINTALVSENLSGLTDSVDTFMGTGNFILILLGGVLIGPAFEEILFRGLIFKELNKTLPLWVALILQSFFYFIGQPNLQTGVYAIFGGLAFVLAYYWSKNLWSAIIIQTASCLVIFLYRRLELSEIISNVNDYVLYSISILSGIGIVLILLSMWKQFKEIKDTNDLSDSLQS